MRVDGQRLADPLLDSLAERIADASDVPGCLATLVVDDDELSHRQAALKHRACERVGMGWRAVRLPTSAATEEVLGALADLSDDAEVHGVFVHLPLPPQVDTSQVTAAVPVTKDVDGLNPHSRFRAASAHGVVDVLDHYAVDLADSDVVVVGEDSPLVRGLADLLAGAGSLTVLGPDAARDRSRLADVLVSAAYRSGLVTDAWVREGAVVIDAASGDVDAASLRERARLLCASPGGIGPLTVARLLAATQDAARALSTRSSPGRTSR